MPSSEWKRFKDNYYGDPYMMFHDGIDETSVRSLEGEERKKAEEMLIESMQQGTHWGAIGLRELRSKTAVPYLKKALSGSMDTLKVEIAVALTLIENDLVYVHEITYVLRHGGSWSRMVAARSLRRFPHEHVVEALFEAVAKDSEYLVRNHASETILFLHGLNPGISELKEYQNIFKLMIVYYDVVDDEARKNALVGYQRWADMLREYVEKEGTLLNGPIIEDI